MITPIRKYCHNCNNWKWEPTIHTADGHSIYPGHCRLYSCRCINAVLDGDKPVHFQPISGVTVDEETAIAGV